jgi:small subunit ribosomal protein S9
MVTTKKTTEKISEKPKTAVKPAVKKAPAKTVKAVKAVKTADAETPKKEIPMSSSADFHKALGRRKEATARVRLIPGGSGKVTVNGRTLENFFSVEWHRHAIMQPLIAVGANADYDVSAKIEGGGIAGQAIALQHGIARCLLLVNPDFRKSLRRAGYLTRDPRAKERKKPGLKRARKRPQWAKR